MPQRDLTELDRGVMDAYPDPIWVVRRGRIAYANSSAHRLVGAVGQRGGIADLLSKTDRARVERRLEARSALPLRVGLCVHGGDRVIPADIRVQRTGGRNGDAFMLTARPATRTALLEELSARIGEVVGDPNPGMGLEMMLATSEPIFSALGWSGALFEIRDETFALSRVIAWRLSGTAAGEFTEAMRVRPAPLSRLSIAAEVVRSGRGRFFDEVDVVLGEAARRNGVPEARCAQIQADFVAAGLVRGAWAPVHHRGRVSHVLTVAGPELDDSDFAAVMLFAHQLSSMLAFGDLTAQVSRRERDVAVGDVASAVAREARHPVAVLRNIASALHHSTPPSVDGAPDLLEIVDEETRRLSHLIDGLAEFAEPLRVWPRSVRVAEVVQQSLIEARARLASDTKTLVFERGPAPELIDGHMVEADPLLLGRALVHLLVHVAETTEAGGEVIVAVEETAKDVRISIRRVGAVGAHTELESEAIGVAVARRAIDAIDGCLEQDAGMDGAVFVVSLPRSSGEIRSA